MVGLGSAASAAVTGRASGSWSFTRQPPTILASRADGSIQWPSPIHPATECIGRFVTRQTHAACEDCAEEDDGWARWIDSWPTRRCVAVCCSGG